MTPRNPHLVFSLLALSLALMLLFIGWRINGQPLPPMDVSVADTNTAPDFIRKIQWTRNTNASSYVLTVNSNMLWMLPATGMNGATMTVTNVGLNTGTNTVALYAVNTNGASPTVTLRHLILAHQDTGWFIEGSPTLLGTYTRTNPPAMERDRKGSNFYFRLKTWQTNWIDERTL